MLQRLVILAIVMLSLVGVVLPDAMAQSPLPEDATPGAVGITGVPLAGLEPAAAPGYALQVVELTWEPGAYATRHFHPTALITCVQQGSLGFVLQHGAATITRGGTADAPGAPEPLALDRDVTLGARDCISFDEFSAHMEHSGWNAGDGPLVLWEARLLDPAQPFTTYVNDQGTPVP